MTTDLIMRVNVRTTTILSAVLAKHDHAVGFAIETAVKICLMWNTFHHTVAILALLPMVLLRDRNCCENMFNVEHFLSYRCYSCAAANGF